MIESFEKEEVVDKWAVIVGLSDESGDPSLHLHRIYESKDRALQDISSLKGIYRIVFV